MTNAYSDITMNRTINVFACRLTGNNDDLYDYISAICQSRAEAQKKNYCGTFYIYATRDPAVFIWSQQKIVEPWLTALDLKNPSVWRVLGHPPKTKPIGVKA